jgi:hypothetical protein
MQFLGTPSTIPYAPELDNISGVILISEKAISYQSHDDICFTGWSLQEWSLADSSKNYP